MGGVIGSSAVGLDWGELESSVRDREVESPLELRRAPEVRLPMACTAPSDIVDRPLPVAGRSLVDDCGEMRFETRDRTFFIGFSSRLVDDRFMRSSGPIKGSVQGTMEGEVV